MASIRTGDKVLFYVEGVKRIFGVFEAVSSACFFSNTQLSNYPLGGPISSGISLQYRVNIKPYKVYSRGLSEFEAIDLIPIRSKHVVWSLIYRKLKGGRGCTSITEDEYHRLFKGIIRENRGQRLLKADYRFADDRIIASQSGKSPLSYPFNASPIRDCIINDNYSEHTLHSLFLEKSPDIIFGSPRWVCNEFAAGAGMQAIDILVRDSKFRFRIIEIKKDEIAPMVTLQIEKYIIWMKKRMGISDNAWFIPVLVGKKIVGDRKKEARIREFSGFNSKRLSQPLVYVEYSVNIAGIELESIDYSNSWSKTGGLVI